MSTGICSDIQRLMEAKTILGVPIVAKEKVVGAFLVNTGLEEISERKMESLVSFANQAAAMAENARLIDMEKRSSKELPYCWLSVMNSRHPLHPLKLQEACLPKN